MKIADIFDAAGLNEIIERVEKLSSDSSPKWGKMTVEQMLAHCNVAFEMTYDDIHQKPNAFVRFMLKMFVKNPVVGPKPYPKNGRTAPQFIISDSRDFNKEKERIVDYLKRTHELGKAHFEGMESHSFGALSSTEWNTMFSKHLDHHLVQFGV